ncbi:MAG: HNH endonuclease [Bradyrhizobium sp.]|nr:HNH endonuclease [Bradyrhizobium sp.]
MSSTTTKRGYCTGHIAAASKDYNKSQPAYHMLYDTAQWQRYRTNQLLSMPSCADCGGPADTVHHMREHRGDRELFFDEGNLQSLCAACHARLHATRGER